MNIDKSTLFLLSLFFFFHWVNCRLFDGWVTVQADYFFVLQEAEKKKHWGCFHFVISGLIFTEEFKHVISR